MDSAVELLEDIYAAPGNSDLNMSFVFRKVLEEGNGEAVDKRKSHTAVFVRTLRPLSFSGRRLVSLSSSLRPDG